MTRPTPKSQMFRDLLCLLAPRDPFLPPFLTLKLPWDPSKKNRLEISYPTVPIRRQETPWVRFYGQISAKKMDPFLAPSSWYPDHSGLWFHIWYPRSICCISFCPSENDWPLKYIILHSPGPPRTYFDRLYPAQSQMVPGQPKK